MMPLIVLIVLNVSTIFTVFFVHIRYSKFCKLVLEERARVREEAIREIVEELFSPTVHNINNDERELK